MVIYANGKYYITSEHVEPRMLERGITEKRIAEVLEKGEAQPSPSEPENDLYVYTPSLLCRQDG